MLTAEQNERITRVGPGTPCGNLLRRYWQPAALVEELETNRPVKAITLLGEDLVLFRDEQGAYGLIERQCCHRGADMSFGRLEDGGLRCPFHGWLFDVNGRCLEQPAEPEGSNFLNKVRQPSYPCIARNGVVFAYMGPGEPPAFPDFDCFVAPESYTFAFKGYWDCNWLQALEVGIDPAHASFLHRFFEDEEDEDYGLQFRGKVDGDGAPLTQLLRERDRPDLRIENTDYGLRLFALRDLDETRRHIRVTNCYFPNAIVIPMADDMIFTQWHVPIDDVSSWWTTIFWAYRGEVDKAKMREDRLQSCTLPDYMPKLNKANNYGFDAEEQRTQTYTGMGMDINTHDQWAVESQGRIQDRSKEHLGSTDRGITAYRKMLMAAIDAVERGGEPPMTLRDGDGARFRGPVAVDTIGPIEGWEDAWLDHDRRRREQSPWAPQVP
jgi:phenylpropionate dioxygenase-like ring-hydroxylating dioxygenase large terminal subunit